MKKILISAAVLLLATRTGLAAEDAKPGLWKITLESSVAATPDWKPPPFEMTQCLSENDARNPDRLLAGAGQGASGCDFLNRQYAGSRLSFDVSCPSQMGMKGHGEVDFSATTLDGVLNVNFGGEQSVEMQNKLHAIYVGECPAGGR